MASRSTPALQDAAPTGRRPDRFLTHGWARAALLGVLVAFFGPMLLRGEVIFPHDNDRELGIVANPAGGRIANRYFRDLDALYVPELHLTLHGERSGWLTTWNPYVEMGRSRVHRHGLSRAFFVTHALSLCTDDPIVVSTWLAILAVVCSAWFGYLFLQSLGLLPAACLAGALGVALGVPSASWLTHSVLLWPYACTLALLWLMTRYAASPSPIVGLGIALTVHVLLLSAFQQSSVWSFYIVAGYGLACLGPMRTARQRFSLGLAIAGFGAIGVLSALPVYLDLWIAAQQSARLEGVDDSFFLWNLARMGGPREWILFTSQLFDSFWYGNPVEPGNGMRYAYFSLTPLFASLLLLSFSGGLSRRIWPWQLLAGLAVLLTICAPAYLFAIHYLGLSFSRLAPIQGAILAFFIPGSYAADHLLRTPDSQRAARVALACLPLVVSASSAIAFPRLVEPAFAAMAVAFSLACLVFAWSPRSSILVAIAIATVFAYGRPLVLSRPRSAIHRTSPMIERIQEETRDGSRFAWVGSAILPSNQEVLYGIRSVHTHNSLSSRQYQEWVLRISERGTHTYGRHFQALSSDARLHGDELSFSGIGLLLSRDPIDPEIATRAGHTAGFGVYRTRERPLLIAQVSRYQREGEGELTIPGSLRDAQLLPVERQQSQGDRIRFQLTPSPRETLLFVSQQYHPQWSARSNGRTLATVRVNAFYQGVLLPPGTEQVVLEFRPFVRFSWIPQLGFGIAAVGALAWTLASRSRRRAMRVPSKSGVMP